MQKPRQTLWFIWESRVARSVSYRHLAQRLTTQKLSNNGFWSVRAQTTNDRRYSLTSCHGLNSIENLIRSSSSPSEVEGCKQQRLAYFIIKEISYEARQYKNQMKRATANAQRRFNRKLAYVALIFYCSAVGTLQVYNVQIVRHDALAAKAAEQQYDGRSSSKARDDSRSQRISFGTFSVRLQDRYDAVWRLLLVRERVRKRDRRQDGRDVKS